MSDLELKELVASLAISQKETDRMAQQAWRGLAELKIALQEASAEVNKTARVVHEISTATDEKINKLEEMNIASGRNINKTEEMVISSERNINKLEEMAISSERNINKLEEMGISSERNISTLKEMAISSGRNISTLKEMAISSGRNISTLKEMSIATDKKINKLEGLFSSQWGKLIEALVEPSSIRLFQERGIAVNESARRYKTGEKMTDMEIDVLLMDTNKIVVIEVKTQCKVAQVREFLEKLQMVKSTIPRFAGCEIFGGIAAVEFHEGSEKFAYKSGLFVIKPAGGMVTIANDLDFKPAAF